MKSITPALVLQNDKNWDNYRPIPTEPSRSGIICIQNTKLIQKFPLLKKYLKKNQNVGCYLDFKSVKKLIKDQKYQLSTDDKSILSISQSLKKTDSVTSFIIASLIFKPTDYKYIENHVHERLTSSTLGPNRELPAKILNFFTSDSIIKYFKNNSHRQVTIHDPFSGSGAMGLLICEALTKKHIHNFEIINGDLSATAHQQSLKILSRFAPDLLTTHQSHLKFVQQNGITMDKIKNNHVDFIISLRALHELTSDQVFQFFSNTQNKLKDQGCVVVVDVTRYPKILSKAKKLLPLLGQFSAFMIGMNQYQNQSLEADRFLNLVVTGDPYLAQAGIYSYKAGFTLKELNNLALKAGFDQSDIKSNYNFDPPIGSVQLVLRKQS